MNKTETNKTLKANNNPVTYRHVTNVPIDSEIFSNCVKIFINHYGKHGFLTNFENVCIMANRLKEGFQKGLKIDLEFKNGGNFSIVQLMFLTPLPVNPNDYTHLSLTNMIFKIYDGVYELKRDNGAVFCAHNSED